MKVLLTEFPFLLAGGPKQDLQEQLAAFWDCYQFFQPGHEVFRKNKDDLAYTLPLILHGDEGRYLKKGNFMVCTVECVLGSDPKKKMNENHVTATWIQLWIGIETWVVGMLVTMPFWNLFKLHPNKSAMILAMNFCRNSWSLGYHLCYTRNTKGCYIKRLMWFLLIWRSCFGMGSSSTTKHTLQQHWDWRAIKSSIIRLEIYQGHTTTWEQRLITLFVRYA